MADIKPLQTKNNRTVQVLLIAIALFLATAANLSLAPNLVIMNARLDFFALFLAVILLRQDKFVVIILAFVCGIVSDFISSSAFGIYTFSYCLAAFVASFTNSSDLNQHSQSVGRLQKYVKLLYLVGVLYITLAVLTILTEGFEQAFVLIVETALPAALYAFLVGMLIYLFLDIIQLFKGRAKSNFDKGTISGSKVKLPKRRLKRGKSKWTL